MRPAFKFEECRTPRSTGTKKDAERGRRGGGYSTAEAAWLRGRITLSGVNSDGKGATRGRVRGRKEEKKKDNAEYENHRERSSSAEGEEENERDRGETRER